MTGSFNEQDCRNKLEEAISRGAWSEAKAGLEDLWRERPTSATAAYLVSRFGPVREHLQMRSCRLAILRSFTVEPAVPLLRAAALAAGIDLQVRLSAHNAYAQEILDGTSALYRDVPDAVILAVQLRDLSPQIWEEFAGCAPESREKAAEEIVRSYREWIAAFRSRSDAALIVHLFELPVVAARGVLDSQGSNGQAATIQRLNDGLRAAAADWPGIYVLHYDALIGRHGRERWHDEQKWLTVRLPIAAEFLPALCSEWLRFLCPICGRTAKVVVTDLDNTLWGGVIGEDGLAGLRLDSEFPGAAYRALQRALLDLYHRGILLAIVSKNNEADAMQVLQEHRGMLLQPRHFAAMRINWRHKADNIREIAEELNVGLDSLVFVDDNPVERAQVRSELPDVTVVELPDDPMRYAGALRDVPMFERVTLSAEDAKRQEFYAHQRLRTELQRSSQSLEDFYRSLRQVVEIERLNAGDLVRAAQLTHKTNQFNLTTRRHSEAELARLAASGDWDVYTVRVLDRFGDNGLVGVCVANRSDGACEIDTLLLSCRVIGRTVESAILHFLAEQSRARGIKVLRGRFVPTSKNRPAASFYADHGFKKVADEENGAVWALDLETVRPSCPDWIEVRCGREMTASV